jgi:hypothetical protein
MPDSEDSEMGKPVNLRSVANQDQVKMIIAETLISALIPIGGKVGEKVYEYQHSHEPIAVRVLESELVGDCHVITFMIKNQTQHGAYLESISVAEPQGRSSIRRKFDQSFGVREIDETSSWLPLCLAPGHEIKFCVEVPKCENRGPISDLSGKLEIEISRLDQKKPETKEIMFRLRW